MIEKLIARLEAATGPDRELDDMIMTAVFGERRASGSPGNPLVLRWHADGCDTGVSLRFTASLDEAIMLIPEEWDWKIIGRRHSPYQGRWPYEAVADQGDLRIPVRQRMIAGFAMTAPLALCIAALRARATTADK